MNIKTLPISPIVPTCAEIADAFRGKYPSVIGLDPIFQACAEEAERLMLEVVTPVLQAEKVYHIRLVSHRGPTNQSNYKVAGYTCPKCKAFDLRSDQRYCHHCGVRVEFYKNLKPSK
jgi:hypothetical protein